MAKSNRSAPGTSNAHREQPCIISATSALRLVEDDTAALRALRLGRRKTARTNRRPFTALENNGTEQEHLNQVFGARLRITALRAERGPGIEFLEYITPPGGRPLPEDAKANDLIFWTTRLVVDDMPGISTRLRASDTHFVSRPDAANSQIVREPDGHALRLVEAGSSLAKK